VRKKASGNARTTGQTVRRKQSRHHHGPQKNGKANPQRIFKWTVMPEILCNFSPA
jgi:hypothetical protein